jgi:hypothetical protein
MAFLWVGVPGEIVGVFWGFGVVHFCAMQGRATPLAAGSLVGD